MVVSIVALLVALNVERTETASKDTEARAHVGMKDRAKPITIEVLKGAALTTYDSTENISSYLTTMPVSARFEGSLDLAKAQAVDECSNSIINPAYPQLMMRYLELSKDLNRKIKIRMLDRLQRRCKIFSATTEYSASLANSLYRRSAQQGNIAAKAKILSEESPQVGYDHDNRLLSILNSGNAEAIYNLSTVFGPSGQFAQSGSDVAGNDLSVYAWQLVACDRGLDCSSTSLVVQQYCLYRGICGYGGSLRENLMQSAVSPENYGRLSAIEYDINTALKGGTLDVALGMGDHR